MGLFRRHRETLNEQLLREAGLDPAHPIADPAVALAAPAEPEPGPGPKRRPVHPPGSPAGDINLGWRGRVESGTGDWDAVVMVKAPALPGSELVFTTLPNGDIIVEEEQGDTDLSALADAVEQDIPRPYRVFASRHGALLWVVGARRIQVATVELAQGDAIELTQSDGVRELRVDGEPSDADVPELERLGEQEGPSYCVQATRIDGDFWEVRALAF